MFRVVFTDGTSFKGGTDYYETKFKDIPDDKQIQSIFVYLPLGGALYLSGAEKYILFCEATTDLTGKNKGKPTLRYQYLMGKYGSKTLSYRISLWEDSTSKYKVGDITTRLLDSDKEYNNQPVLGWHRGI